MIANVHFCNADMGLFYLVVCLSQLKKPARHVPGGLVVLRG